MAENTAVPLKPGLTVTVGAETVPVALTNAPSPEGRVSQGEGQPFQDPGAVPSKNSITKSVEDRDNEAPVQVAGVPEQVVLMPVPVSKEAVEPDGGNNSKNSTDKLPEFPGALMLKFVCPEEPPIA